MKIDDLIELVAVNPEQAATALAALIETQPCAEYFELYGHTLLKLNQAEQAVSAYKKALTFNHKLLKAHFGLAQALQKLGNFAEALKHLTICLAAMPEQIVFLFQTGACQLQLGDIPAAKQAFEKVLVQSPRHIEALVNLGTCHLQEKNYQQAIQQFATACRIDEAHLPARYNLACTLMENKRYLQARDQFEIYLRQQANDLEAHYHLGFCYLMLEDLNQAQACFQKILNQNANHILAMYNLASIALKQNEASVALGFYQRILALKPNDEIASYMSAALAQKTPPKQAPNDYIKALFDQYAERFDQHLTEDLHYQTPEQLYRLWQKYGTENNLTILDLGCGTGLMAPLLKPHANKLIGVDLSAEMLKQAKNKALYDQLIETEINDFLNNCQDHFDLVVLADVLVYFGDLSLFFSQLKKITNAILFSIEHTDQANFTLTINGRYQHNLQYVLKLAEQAGFKYKTKTKVTLRTQNTHKVIGDLVFCYV